MSPAQISELFEYYLGVHCYTQSAKTLKSKRDCITLFLSFLDMRGYSRCSRVEVADFIRHALTGHTEPGGRWGRGEVDVRAYKPARPRTAQLYHDYLKAFFEALVADGQIEVSPLQGLKRPRVPREEIVPFSREQYEALLQAARVGRCPERDLAILTLMFDTGLRREEVAAIRRCDIDLKSHTIEVIGKRSKKRLVAFGDEATRALLIYLSFVRPLELPDDVPIFRCSRKHVGEPLTAEGIYRMFKRHGIAAGLSNVRCSPHTMRHTFATEFMLLGATQRAVMRQMGHEGVEMAVRYQHIADAQMAAVHRAASPADNLKRTRGTRMLPSVTKPRAIPKGGRPRQPLESFPCNCEQCPDRPKKSCPRGNVIIKRMRRERARLKNE